MITKQIIIFRRDLKCRKGKFAAQCCHASIQALLNRFVDSPKGCLSYVIDYGTPLYDWYYGLQRKIVVGCDSEAELFELKRKADEANLPNAIIQDAGLTEFKEPTYTCLAIGPDYSEKIDKITSHLKLL